MTEQWSKAFLSRSSARSAARKAGANPNSVRACLGGFQYRLGSVPADKRSEQTEQRPTFAPALTDTERDYYAARARDRALRNELRRPQFAAMRAKQAAEQAERDAIAGAVQVTVNGELRALRRRQR